MLSVLITGISGYIGGSIVTALLHDNRDWSSLEITALVRSHEQANVLKDLPIQAIVVPDFDHVEELQQIAERFDYIIHAGAGWHTELSKAFIRGLSVRKAVAGGPVAYLQISGTSNLSDRPHSTGFVEDRVFSDEDDIFSYEKCREEEESYYQRATDVAVVETEEALRIPTYIIMAPTIFGLGKGLFNRFSVQLPAMIGDTLETGNVRVIGSGQTIWSHVHIDDITEFILLLLHRIVNNGEIPSGPKGVYFCESGEHTHLEMAERLLKACGQLGIARGKVKHVSLEEAADAWAGGNKARVELSFGANSRCRAVQARNMGRKPRHEDKWENTFLTELEEYARAPRPKALPKVMQKSDSNGS